MQPGTFCNKTTLKSNKLKSIENRVVQRCGKQLNFIIDIQLIVKNVLIVSYLILFFLPKSTLNPYSRSIWSSKTHLQTTYLHLYLITCTADKNINTTVNMKKSSVLDRSKNSMTWN